MWHMGSWFSNQGLNLCPLHWRAWSLNQWTTRKVPGAVTFGKETQLPVVTCWLDKEGAGGINTPTCVFFFFWWFASQTTCQCLPLAKPHQNLESKIGPFRLACLVTEPGEERRRIDSEQMKTVQCSDGSVKIIQNPALLRTLSFPCGCALLLLGGSHRVFHPCFHKKPWNMKQCMKTPGWVSSNQKSLET